MGELLAQLFESVWYWLVRQNHRDLFPTLPDYTRYHQVARNAERFEAIRSEKTREAQADKRESEVKEGQVVAGLLFPADEESAEAVDP